MFHRSPRSALRSASLCLITLVTMLSSAPGHAAPGGFLPGPDHAIVVELYDTIPELVCRIIVTDSINIARIKDLCPSGDCSDAVIAAQVADLLGCHPNVSWGELKWRMFCEYCRAHPRDPECKGVHC